MEAEVDRFAYRPHPDSSDDFNVSLPAFWMYTERAALWGSTAAVYLTLARQQAFRLLPPTIEDPRRKNRRAVRPSLVEGVCCRQNG